MLTLFPFTVQHLHQEAVERHLAVQVFVIQVVFTFLGELSDVWQHAQHHAEFIVNMRIHGHGVVQEGGADLVLTVVNYWFVL